MLSPMRRRERAVTDWNHVLEIIQSCDCCRVAFSEPDGPYIVPMNFGIESSQEGQMVLYFHGASAGKKGELMQKNPCVWGLRWTRVTGLYRAHRRAPVLFSIKV